MMWPLDRTSGLWSPSISLQSPSVCPSNAAPALIQVTAPDLRPMPWPGAPLVEARPLGAYQDPGGAAVMSEITYERIQAHLTRLKLPRMAALVDAVAEEAANHEWTYLAFLDRCSIWSLQLATNGMWP